MAQSLKQLTYRSKAADGITEDDVADIVSRSEFRNKSLGITGILAFYDGHFFQCLEGKPEVVDLLLEVIKNDKRHQNVQTLMARTVETRSFPHWSMADAHTLLGDAAIPALSDLFDAERLAER